MEGIKVACIGNFFRKASLASFISVLCVEANIVGANDIQTNVYFNDRYHTELRYPTKWTEKIGSLSGDRSIIAFTDPDDADTSASLVFTPIPADFTRLTSFGGGKDTLREYLLPRGDEIEATVINEKIKGETYTLEYVVKAPNNPTRHVISVFALRPQESVVGLTVQTKEDDYESKKSILESIPPSLRIDVE